MCVGKPSFRFDILRLIPIATVLILTAASSAPAWAGNQLEQVGLRQQWFSHSGTSGEQLADMYLAINPDKSTTFFTIAGGDYTETYSEFDRAPSGQEYGVEYGLKVANIKKEIAQRRLQSQSGQPTSVTVSQYSMPETTLYTLASNGMARSYDAETGKLRWSKAIGTPSRVSHGMAGFGDKAVVVNGSTVYCLNAASGAVEWSKRCKGVPSAPPAMDSRDIFVPLINGRMERMSILDKGFASVAFVSGGRGAAVTTRPAVSSLSAAWGNYAGRLSLAGHGNLGGRIAAELTSDAPILADPKYKDGMYFATSLDGYVYGLTERYGNLAWENGTGFSISQSPILIGNDVFVINDQNQLFKFDAKTGGSTAQWQKPRPNVGKFVGASRNKLYTIDRQNILKAIDVSSGTTLGQAAVGSVARVLPNIQSDRIYIVDKAGTIRCYSEVGANQPYFHADELVAQTPPAADTAPPAVEPENPFGKAENPFGDEPAAESDDTSPFDDSDDTNPFGDDDDTNPFGDG